ncbi:MAG: chemotaxis protein CheW [Pirellulales bacterium]|nr:chemotaxis protein CheW [Pirellulales bacterium]
MQARMQPIDTVFGRFPRVVRDLSNALGKQCELRLEGTDVELDKSIIEAIGDPLTHLVRNAVDHGIESPQQRAQLGKPAKGTIVLRAYHQAGKVNITITDNGRGIDAVRLREKAVARGLIIAEQARDMSDREALRLIFRPGFSMAEKVTDVSGRGVGMDVVKTNIERLGGTVGVETEVGAGTTLEIRLPLTLAIVPSLIVRCGGQRFAIPQASISELVRVKAEETRSRIQRIHDAEVIRLRGELLPLVRLERALGLAGDRGPSGKGALVQQATHVIVVETGALRYGIRVDGLHDSEEIVVKPLGRHMQDCPCLAGATILGDGRVAMILDVAGIAAHCRLALPDETGLGGESDDALQRAENQTMLLFSNDPSEWFAVPMDLILRVERIRSDQIDSVGGQMVLQYRGSSLPLLSLDQHIRARSRPEKPRVYVAVYRVLQREVGMIVPELVDIRQLSTDVDTATFREPGVAGSLVIDGRTTRLLDLYELTESARPDWFRSRPAPPGDAERRPVVLLAEDSEFFRKQLTAYLAAEHYEVVACADGKEAWDAVRSAPKRFDLVVTDVEMPRMDGLELARHIKTDPALSHLPVIAVTSLAGEEDTRRGKAAGVDEYLIKLDRDQIVEVTSRYLRAGAGADRG